jgi:hypothetical protein
MEGPKEIQHAAAWLLLLVVETVPKMIQEHRSVPLCTTLLFLKGHVPVYILVWAFPIRVARSHGSDSRPIPVLDVIQYPDA